MTGDALARLNAALEARYRVERALGEGGMALVYLAEDLKHKRKVALKVLARGGGDQERQAPIVLAENWLEEVKAKVGGR